MKRRLAIIFLLSLTAVAFVTCYIIARPFLRSIISAALIAIVFFPVHTRLAKWIRKPGLAALVSTVLVLLIIVIPSVLIGIAVTRELRELYHSLSAESSESGGWTPYLLHLAEKPVAWLGRYVDVSSLNVRQTVLNSLRQASGFIVGRSADLFGNVASFAFNFVITLFTLFFLFREGRTITRRVAAVLPLTSAQVEKLYNGISNAVVATMYGGLAVAATQGTLTSIGFAVLGLPSPILWGVVTAMLSLVPMVGSAAVWVPASLILFATGNWVKGLILLGYGAGVIGTIDNVIRPYVMSGKVKLHTLLVFFAVLGGVRAFGILGLFIGPITLAVTMALIEILREEGKAWQATWSEEPGPIPTDG